MKMEEYLSTASFKPVSLIHMKKE
eukprot:UN15751